MSSAWLASSLPGRRKKIELSGYAFVSAHVIIFTLFWLLPIGAAVLISFTRWGIIETPKWVGISNYKELVGDPFVWRALRVSLTYTIISVPLQLGLSLMMALYVNRRLVGSTFARLVFFAPWVLSASIVGMTWLWIMSPGHGVLGYYLTQVGVEKDINWLGNRNIVLFSIAMVAAWWQAGFGMIIYLAALQDIPQAFYDSAAIDGASLWQRLWHITWPMLTPATSFVLIVNTILAMRVIALPMMMTRGGPGVASTTLLFKVWWTGFVQNRMGYASALSVVVFLFIFVIALVELRLVRQRIE